MKRMFVAVLLGLALIIASAMSAQAAPKGVKLHGEYSLIGTRTCVQHNLIDTNFFGLNYALGSEGTTRTVHYNGILKLFGDGTGHFSDKAIQINHNNLAPGNTPSAGWTDTCDVNYQAGEDGAIQLDFLNCISTTLWPNPLGMIITNSSDAGPLSMTISANGDTLLMSNVATEPDVETTWTCGIDASSGQPNCDIQVNTFYRICARSFTAIRLSPR